MTVFEATHGIAIIPPIWIALGFIFAIWNRTLTIAAFFFYTALPVILIVFLLGLHFISGGVWP